VTSVDTSFDIHQTYAPGVPITDIVPTGSQLTFGWHSVLPLPSVICTGYRYRLDEPKFNVVGASVRSATYNTHIGGDIIAPGVKKFTLQAQDQSGWHGDSTRYFQMNFEPDDWFSGPDTLDGFWNTYQDGKGKRYWYRDVSQWPYSITNTPWIFNPPAGDNIPGTMMSPDSASVMAAVRPHRKTFFEIFGNRIWAHAEGDTVNLNSIVIFPMGGIDFDSPYAVHVGASPGVPFAVGPVTTAGPANGSPIGFRSLVVTRKVDATFQVPTETTTFPVFDVTSPYWLPYINPIADMQTTGQGIAYAAAEDGDGAIDRRILRANIGGASKIVDLDPSPDSAQAPPGTSSIVKNARAHILTFYINHKPYLNTGDPQFVPAVAPDLRAPQSFRLGSAVQFNLLAGDADPIDYEGNPVNPGGPGQAPVLVYTVSITGRDSTSGADTTITIATSIETAGTFAFTMPSTLKLGPATADITLCDYRPNDALLGNFGRCADTMHIPILITATAPARASSISIENTTHRPGSPPEAGRRQLP
jgi:hypothetical protein